MLFTVSKIIYQSGKSYLLFIFLATFLSLFSYILSSNIISSVDSYLKEQTRPLLGGDLVLSGNSEFDSEYFESRYSDELNIYKTIETQTTLFDENQQPSLTQLVYHDAGYPLYDSFSYDIVDESGSIIVDPVLREKFGESLELFGEEYRIKGVVSASPLGDFSAFSVSSKIYIPIEYYNPELSLGGARVDTRYYAGFIESYDAGLVRDIKNDTKFDSFRVSSLDDRNENIGEITDRLSLFINFFNLIVFVLTFFIIILSLETFYKKLKKTLGLLTILGLSKGKMFLYNLAFIAFIFSIALAGAIVMNYFVLMGLGGLYDFLVFYPSSILQGMLITGVLLIIGVYSPFYKIYTSRISDLLSDSSFFSNFAVVNYFVYLSLLFIGFYCISIISNISVFWAFMYSIGFTLSIVLLYLVSALVLRGVYIVSKGVLKKMSFYSFDSLRSTIKPGNVSFFIVFSSFISFLSIFVFYVFSGSFLSFINNFTESSNDSFILDVSPGDIDIAREYFTDEEIYTVVPMRIVEINGQSLENYARQNQLRARRYSREFLSTTRNLDSDMTQGRSVEAGGVSVDEEFALELGIDLGDEIEFSVAGLEKILVVQNIRKAVRSGATPFFYFSVFESDFEGFPKRYFVSYKSAEKPENTQFEYSQDVGGDVTFINAKEIIEIVLDVAQKVLLIVYFCLAYVTIFSFLTFLVSIGFLKSFKDAKLTLMHILGGKKNKLENAVVGEYIYLMLFGLMLAVLFGSIALSIMQGYVEFFSLDFASYIQGIILVGTILLIMSLYLYVSKKTPLK